MYNRILRYGADIPSSVLPMAMIA
eukprot:COSAG02_NODE_65473_length_258_cov_0.616352_1_plen_23_part_10